MSEWWYWVLFGLAVGIVVVAAVYWDDGGRERIGSQR